MEVKKITGDIVRVAYDELSRNYIYEKNYKALDNRIQVVSINDIDDYLKCDNIELIMIGRAHYDFMSYRRINKERRNLYKQLAVLHKNAYEKGIFQTPEPCYTREFIEWTKERVP